MKIYQNETPKTGPKMDQNWVENRSKIYQNETQKLDLKWTRNGLKIYQNKTQKLDLKWTRNGLKIEVKPTKMRFKNGSKVDQKSE